MCVCWGCCELLLHDNTEHEIGDADEGRQLRVAAHEGVQWHSHLGGMLSCAIPCGQQASCTERRPMHTPVPSMQESRQCRYGRLGLVPQSVTLQHAITITDY